MNVDLPAPFGPISPTTSPGRIVSDTSFTASTTPKRTRTASAASVCGAITGRSCVESSATRWRPNDRRRRRSMLARPFGSHSSTTTTTTPSASWTIWSLSRMSPKTYGTIAPGASAAPSSAPTTNPMPPMTA